MSLPDQYTLFVYLAPLIALVTAGVLVAARRHRTATSAPLVWLMLAVIGWLMFNTLEVVAGSEIATLSWSKITYAFIAFTPVAWIAFALRYTGNVEWLRPLRFALFLVIPLMTTVLALTNELHWFLWLDYYYRPIDGMLAFNVDHGPWFWVHTAHSYLLVFVGALLILRTSYRSFPLYRLQSIWLASGALLPLLANFIYIFNFFPSLTKDYTPLSFALSAIAFTVGIYRYRLFDLQPVARDAMIDSMSDAMLALDSEDRIVDLNPTAAAIIGQPAQNLVGKPLGDIVGRWRHIVRRYRDRLEVQEELQLEIEGERRFFDLRLSPLYDNQGRPNMRLIVLRDITERHVAEASLRQRTVELEARNEELDAFAHTVAHDLKSPLAVLTGFGELLINRREHLEEAEIEHYLSVILRNGLRMGTIVDELLLLARVRRADDITLEPLKMAPLVAEACDRLQAEIAERRAAIVLPEKWPVAVGYAPWISEVWANYLSNAIKYGGSSPRIELGATENDGEVRFWVQDSGPGIDPALQDRLFRRFERLDASEVEGHGLGLSIVRRIVERLDGDVGVESSPGSGSRFWFTLPIDGEAEQEEAEGPLGMRN